MQHIWFALICHHLIIAVRFLKIQLASLNILLVEVVSATEVSGVRRDHERVMRLRLLMVLT